MFVSGQGAACDLVDLMFILDSSGSIGAENWKKVVAFTAAVVKSINVGPQQVSYPFEFNSGQKRA